MSVNWLSSNVVQFPATKQIYRVSLPMHADTEPNKPFELAHRTAPFENLSSLLHVFVHIRSSEKESEIRGYLNLLYSFSFGKFYEVPHFSTAPPPAALFNRRLHWQTAVYCTDK